MKKVESRYTVLCFTAHYLPGYYAGGPIRSISNFVKCLGEEYNIMIVTSDRDLNSNSSYPNISIDEWNVVGNANVFYASPKTLTLRGISKLIESISFDILYLNSYFQYRYTILPLIARHIGLIKKKQCLIAPRGEFSQGALSIKAMKKKVYIKLFRLLRLYSSVHWQASSKYELCEITRVLPYIEKNKIHIASNIPNIKGDEIFLKKGIDGQALKICFLSRISPKKNLDYALRVLMNVTSNVIFTIYGIKESREYWQKCKKIIEKIPSNVKIIDGGELKPDEIEKYLVKQELFFFPTKGENYGHVIHEALVAGLPVLISDKTPWTNLYELGVGWDLPLESEIAFVNIIEDLASMTKEKYFHLRMKAREYASENSINSSSVKKHRIMFNKILNESASKR